MKLTVKHQPKNSAMISQRILEPADTKLFFKLIELLDLFVAKNITIEPVAGTLINEEVLYEFRERLHNAWHKNPSLIDQFLLADGSGLPEEEKDIVRGWKSAKSGDFIYIKYYQEYAVMQPIDSETEKFYGVVGLNDDFATIMHLDPPCIINTMLFAF